MNAREALNSAVDALEKMGFVILSRSEVEAIRDQALEEAAEIAQYIPASQAVATAIRALKSGGDK